MLRKTLAGLLLILTALPFTAPFATVDVPTLLGTRGTLAGQPTSLAPSIDDTSHALVAPSTRARSRIRTVLRLDTLAPGLVAAATIGHAPKLDTNTAPPAGRSSLTPLRI